MSTMTQPCVAVGYGGSGPSKCAVDAAMEEALRRGLPLRLITAVEVFPYDSLAAADHGDVAALPAVQRASAVLDELAAQIRAEHADLEVTTCVRGMTPAALLVEESGGADLLVIGEHHGLPFGALGDAVTAHARCPVLVVRSGAGHGGPVVLGVDGSDASERAVAFAFEEAQLRNATVEALHVYSPWSYADPASARKEGDEEEERLLAESLAGWSEKYPDVPVTRVLRRERAATALLEASRHAQLLVVGSRGRGGFEGLLLGSVSRTVLHHAACSVAVVRGER